MRAIQVTQTLLQQLSAFHLDGPEFRAVTN